MTMKQWNSETIKSKGVTLIEMLVAVTIFTIILGAISGLFISGIRTQRRVLATQELLDQTSYAFEYMGRALRMAKKDLTGNCLTTAGAKYNYENPGGDISKIRFIKFDHATQTELCQEYLKEENQLKERKSTDATAANLPATGTPLTSEKLQVTSLKFNLSGESQTDNLQPRVTISSEILGRGAAGEQPKIQIQTTISQRNLDIQR